MPGPGTDQPVAHIETVGAPATHYYYQDRLGNIVALANASGSLAERYLYSAYGQGNRRLGRIRTLTVSPMDARNK